MFALFFKGIIIGFLIAMPVGPIALLCIQRALVSGFRIGFITGFGAAVADGFFALLAGLGFAAVFSSLVVWRDWISIVASLCLMGLGLKLLLTPFHNPKIKGKETKGWHAFTTAFILTLTNPLTILAFVSIFATLGLRSMGYTHAILLSAGVCIGSGAWWVLLSFIVAFILHHRLSAAVLQMINRLSGIVFIALGLLFLVLLRQAPSLI